MVSPWWAGVCVLGVCSRGLSQSYEDRPTAVVTLSERVAMLAAESGAAAVALGDGVRCGPQDLVLGPRAMALSLSPGYCFVGPRFAHPILVAWGNPPSDDVLGMVLAQDTDPLGEESWGAILSYTERGHVVLDDQGPSDAAALSAVLLGQLEQVNRIRADLGYPEVVMVKWLEPPHYDRRLRKLRWGQELDFGDSVPVLNRVARAPGRSGVLEISVVGDGSQVDKVERLWLGLLETSTFRPGHRQGDFVPGRDPVAGRGVAALLTYDGLPEDDPELRWLGWASGLLPVLGWMWAALARVRKQRSAACNIHALAQARPDAGGSD